jgi:hypothetical protein
MVTTVVASTTQIEFGLYRSLGGLCKNEYYLVSHPLEPRNSHKKWSHKSHEKFLARLLAARPGLARPCSNISRVNHARPLSLELFGALQTSEPLQVLSNIPTYIRTYGLKFLARTGLQDETQVSREKSRTRLAWSCRETKLYTQSISVGPVSVGSYKLPLSQYTCVNLVGNNDYQQKCVPKALFGPYGAFT